MFAQIHCSGDLIMGKNFIEVNKSKSFEDGAVCTYCKAFLYQPALKFGQRHVPFKYKYVFSILTRVSSYLKVFLPPEKKKVKERGTFLTSKGISGVNNVHKILNEEGSFKCSSCLTCFCCTCGYSPVKDRDKKGQRQKA